MSVHARPPTLLFLLALASGCSTTPAIDLGDSGVTDSSVAAPAADAASPPDAGPAPARDAEPAADAPEPSGPDATAPDAEPQPVELLERLRAVPGLDVTEIAARVEGTRAFVLGLSQPEDHGAPAGKQLRQRLVLVHRSESAPMVLMTTGYGLFGDPEQFAEYLVEPTVLLEANQLTVEHRYFGTSIATDADWSFLTVAQSAADSHRIVQLLGTIYTGPWVGTGASKGGMTAIFHHRHYPRDLAAIVPYVAPISFGTEDPRYLAWLDQIGPADGVCRARVEDMALEMIERRREAAQYFVDTDPRAAPIDRPVLEALVTYPTFGFHWAFWQYYGSTEVCDLVPARGEPIDQLAPWFPLEPSYLTDPGTFDPELSPYGYQVLHELGGQAIDYSYLSPAVDEVDYSVMPTLVPPPPPWGADPPFDARPMLEVDRFLRTEAQHVLGVYGAWDPWTGGIITVDAANDSAVVIVPGANHGAALAELPEDEQAAAIARLEGWVGRRALVASRGPSASTRAAMARVRADARGHQAVLSLTRAAEAKLRRLEVQRRVHR